MIEVVATDEFTTWYGQLDEGDADAVTRSVETLRFVGVVLGFPQSSAIKGTN